MCLGVVPVYMSVHHLHKVPGGQKGLLGPLILQLETALTGVAT